VFIKKIIPVVFLALLILSVVSAYDYMPNIRPHTRYNPLRAGCYYYYGYGSCQVENAECRGVSIGRNKWVDLGDACDRNDPPILTGITATESEIISITAKCLDQDPVTISYSGWTEQAETLATYNDAGKHEVTITCTDSFGETAAGIITIIIKDKNRAPLFRAIGIEVE
jgi:hypothetical protein